MSIVMQKNKNKITRNRYKIWSHNRLLIEKYGSARFFLFFKATLINNARLKFAKNQAKAKEHPEAELLLFENYSLSLTTLLSINNSKIF